ncbi:MAG: hypothetical protein IKK84_00315 [Clostridia bacterium]|nr:hypothetical protein [Clostridia bacterium]
MNEKDVLKFIYNWNVLERRISNLQERVKGHQYKITPSYDITGVCASGFSNKLEKYCMKDLENRKELEELIKERDYYLKIFRSAPLTELERDLIKHIAYCGQLSAFAKKNKLYPPYHAKSYVYKLRDNACLKVYNTYTNYTK